ncbi:hypothetical protein [Microbacterium oxydans]|uniref:hypothetical protein n=1 Tax=Microbacterium oxydans TaxID=82380 RepID=UPI0022B0AD54|nr:hypothetical protein [Microbacterium oxydans]MCZ4302517.1 hypothetical protein [Microbacterium oxydans]
MGEQIQIPIDGAVETVRVSMVVKDDRGFTHYYEDVVTTPEAVRDAFDLLVRRAPSVGE